MENHPQALPLPRGRGTDVGAGLNIIAGAWLFISAFWLGGGIATFWNNLFIGAIVAVLAAVRFFGNREAAGLSWITVVAGLWTIISPWALAGRLGGGIVANQVIAGIIIAALGLWSVLFSASGYDGPNRAAPAGA